MAKQNVTVRLEGDLVEWADRYAAERRWKRTTVFEAALEALRGDAAGGVPDPPATRVENLAETAKGEVVKARPDRSASFQSPGRRAEPARDVFPSVAAYERAMARWRLRGEW